MVKESTKQETILDDSRETEDRRLELRINELTPTLAYEYRHPLYAVPKAPNGWVYSWVCYATLGNQQHNTLAKAAAKGWSPVPKSRHPEIITSEHEYDGKSEHFRSSILYGGLMLMEMPAIIYAKNQQKQNAEAINTREAFPGQEMVGGDKAMPVEFINQNKLTNSFDF